MSQSVLSELLKSNLAHPVKAMVEIELAGITALDLEPLTRDHFTKISKMVVLDGDGVGSCDPAKMRLVHFDGTR